MTLSKILISNILSASPVLYIDAIATSPNQTSRNCYFMHICMQNMQNLKYHALSKILQKTSKYCATSYGMIAIELLKNSKISLQKK